MVTYYGKYHPLTVKEEKRVARPVALKARIPQLSCPSTAPAADPSVPMLLHVKTPRKTISPGKDSEGTPNISTNRRYCRGSLGAGKDNTKCQETLALKKRLAIERNPLEREP